MGSGGLVLWTETCMVELAGLPNFMKSESCGKCTPCRKDQRMLEILTSLQWKVYEDRKH